MFCAGSHTGPHTQKVLYWVQCCAVNTLKFLIISVYGALYLHLALDLINYVASLVWKFYLNTENWDQFRAYDSVGSGGGSLKCAFLTNPQVMLVLLVNGSRFFWRTSY